MQISISALGCNWKDVLHFSAVHPSKMKKALLDSGSKTDFNARYYEIDPMLIDCEKTVVYLYTQINRDFSKGIPEKEFTSYDPNELEQYSVIPQQTKDYYREIFGKEGKPLLFVGIPHILYCGSLDISNVPIVSA